MQTRNFKYDSLPALGEQPCGPRLRVVGLRAEAQQLGQHPREGRVRLPLDPGAPAPSTQRSAQGTMEPEPVHGSTMLTGAAVGAIAGGLLPVVTWPIGLVAGAGYMLYKRLRP